MDPLSAALEFILSLDVGEKPNYTQIAKKYGVGRDRLAQRHRGRAEHPRRKIRLTATPYPYTRARAHIIYR
jgi:hypothetical protein